jgi:hypothetical protein
VLILLLFGGGGMGLEAKASGKKGLRFPFFFKNGAVFPKTHGNAPFLTSSARPILSINMNKH